MANENFIFIGKDISKEKSLEEQLYFLLNQDPVIGLFSYSFLIAGLDMHVRRALEMSA